MNLHNDERMHDKYSQLDRGINTNSGHTATNPPALSTAVHEVKKKIYKAGWELHTYGNLLQR